jgi:Cu+-exporting ATPase
MTKKTYKVKGMDCASCATLIELDLEDAGVKASCKYASETLALEFDDNKVDEEKIKEIVKKSGYELL